jgi:hypothetical protein
MRPSQNFGALRATSRYRLARLRQRAVEGLLPDFVEQDRHFAYVILETQNLWSNFVRSYLLSCLRTPRRIKNPAVTITNAAVTTPGDVILIATRVWKGPAASAPADRRDEPPWHEKRFLLKTVREMQCSHYLDVEAALGIATRVIDDLPTFRNFYAHRNKDSARKAVELARRYYLITGFRHPTHVLAQPGHHRPQPLILDWLDDLSVIFDFLCE